jgi:hypothetical protein
MVREERRLWRKQNIHDRFGSCNAECSKTRTSLPALLGRFVEQDGFMEKIGEVKGQVVEKEVVRRRRVQLWISSGFSTTTTTETKRHITATLLFADDKESRSRPRLDLPYCIYVLLHRLYCNHC